MFYSAFIEGEFDAYDWFFPVVVAVRFVAWNF